MPKRIPHSVTQKGERTAEVHESFGLVQFNRGHGGLRALFGSHVDIHSSYITMTVCQAEVEHDLGRDLYCPRSQLIEITMSAAQFAELITTLNSGSGVPCTVNRVDGVRMEDLPTSHKTENEKVRDSFKQKLTGLVTFVKQKNAEVNSLMEKKSFTMADKTTIKGVLAKTLRELESNAPFLLESFQESADKVVTAAKSEIDAFMSLSLHRLGLDEARKQMGEGKTVKSLTSGED